MRWQEVRAVLRDALRGLEKAQSEGHVLSDGRKMTITVDDTWTVTIQRKEG